MVGWKNTFGMITVSSGSGLICLKSSLETITTLMCERLDFPSALLDLAVTPKVSSFHRLLYEGSVGKVRTEFWG